MFKVLAVLALIAVVVSAQTCPLTGATVQTASGLTICTGFNGVPSCCNSSFEATTIAAQRAALSQYFNPFGNCATNLLNLLCQTFCPTNQANYTGFNVTAGIPIVSVNYTTANSISDSCKNVCIAGVQPIDPGYNASSLTRGQVLLNSINEVNTKLLQLNSVNASSSVTFTPLAANNTAGSGDNTCPPSVLTTGGSTATTGAVTTGTTVNATTSTSTTGTTSNPTATSSNPTATSSAPTGTTKAPTTTTSGASSVVFTFVSFVIVAVMMF